VMVASMFRNRNPNELKRVIEKLGPKAGDAVAAALKSPEAEARQGAIQIIAMLPSIRPTLPALRKALDDEDAKVRRAAALQLAMWGEESPEVLRALARGLEDKDGRPYEIINLLGQVSNKNLKVLAGWSADDKFSPAVRGELLGLLENRAENSPEALEALTRATQSPDAEIKLLAVLLIAPHKKPRDPALGDRILEGLQSENQKIRQAADDAMYSMGTDAHPLVPKVVDLILDEKKGEALREDSPDSLYRLKLKAAALPHVMKLVKNPKTRFLGINLLGSMKGEASGAIPELTAMMSGEDESARRSAAQTLGRMGPAALPALVEIARNAERPAALRKQAIDALGQLAYFHEEAEEGEQKTPKPDRDKVVAALREIRQQSKPPVKTAACLALVHWKALDEGLMTDLLATLTEDDDDHYAVWEVMSQLGPQVKTALPRLRELACKGSPRMRLETIGQLGQLSREIPEVLPLIFEGLREPGIEANELSRMPQQMSYSLSNLSPASLPVLIEALSDKQEVIASIALNALAVRRAALPAAAIEPLQQVLSKAKEGSDERLLAALALSHAKPVPAGVAEELVSRLDGGRNQRTPEICAALARLGVAAKPAVPKMLAMAGDPNTGYAIIDSLGKLGPHAGEAVPTLTQLLDNARLGSQAAAALGAIGAPAETSVPQLLESLDRKSMRWSATAALIRLGPAGTKPLVEKLVVQLNDPDQAVEAARAIQQVGKDAAAALPALRKGSASKDKEVRQASIWALGGLDSPEAVADLVKLLENPDKETRQTAVQGLRSSEKAAKGIAPQLIPLLKKPDVAPQALDALGSLGESGAAAVPAIQALLKDKDKDVKMSVCTALGRIGAPAAPAVPALTDLLADKDKDLRNRAIMSLGGIGPKAAPAVGKLIALLNDKDSLRSVLSALGQIGPDAAPAVPKLMEMLKGDSRSPAMSALGGIKAAEALPAMIEALDDREMRYSAIQALGRMGPAAKPALEKLKSMGSPEYQRMVDHAVAQIEGREPVETPDDE
jgi:HEAT repeat protein